MFNSVLLTGASLPTPRCDANNQGGFDVTAQTTQGDFRIAQVVNGGGHWEWHILKGCPANVGIELDTDGYPLFHKV